MTLKSTVLSWIPKLREVEDFPKNEEIEDLKLIHGQKTTKNDVEASTISINSSDKNESDIQLIEYRDEANRHWWSFFNEYEYRLNSYETKKHKWWYWFDEGTSKAEKKLLWKLDILVAFYVFLIYWVKSLDSSNLSNAYVSNMKEDLNFKGNDYINTVTCYNVAAVVFQIPAMYLFPRFPLHLYIPILDLIWGIFTLCTYKVKTVTQLQVMRFFVGAAEASFYPAGEYFAGQKYCIKLNQITNYYKSSLYLWVS